jgi:hypothetical protein
LALCGTRNRAHDNKIMIIPVSLIANYSVATT